MNPSSKRCSGYGPAGIEPHYTDPGNFARTAGNKDGLSNFCRDCSKIKNTLANPNRRLGGKYAKAREDYHNRERHLKRSLPYDPTVNRLGVWLCNLGLCHLCGMPVPFELMTMEHSQPMSKGGGYTWDNIRPAHAYCNARKGCMTMAQFEARGIRKKLQKKGVQLALTSG